MVLRHGMDLFRKTNERDVNDMVEDKGVTLILGMPTRYQLIQSSEVDLTLWVEEITHLFDRLYENFELHQELRRS